MKRFYVMGLLLCLSFGSMAENTSIDQKYRATTFEIKNNTAYAQLVNLPQFGV